MRFFLKISRLIDALNRLIGRGLIWLILAATLISAGNALVRKLFHVSSNAMLEIQWYLYAAVFMLGAGAILLRNAHVRIDVLANRLSHRGRLIIDIVGIVLFLLPLCYFMTTLAWPLVERAYLSGEGSPNFGGLRRWPVYALIPLGFTLLGLQAFSELIKRIGYLSGAVADDPLRVEGHADAPDSGGTLAPASRESGTQAGRKT